MLSIPMIAAASAGCAYRECGEELHASEFRAMAVAGESFIASGQGIVDTIEVIGECAWKMG